MAEVLITLGIIGVVAALTIPTLISNYQKKSYVSALQKSYANLSNGFKLMAATEGVDYLGQTSFWRGLKLEDGVATSDSIVESINNNLSKYFKIVDIGYGENSLGDNTMIYYLNGDIAAPFSMFPHAQLQDGSMIIFYHVDNNQWNNHRAGNGAAFMQILLDVNGFKEPNVVGRDLFMVDVSDYGINGEHSVMQILPFGAHISLMDEGKVVPYSDTDYTNYDGYGRCGDIGTSDTGDDNGVGCFDRIIEEGWKMNY